MAEFCYFCKKKIGLFGKLSSEKVENQFVCGDCVDNKIQIGSLKDIFLTRFVLGVLLGLILIPVAILKKLFIH